MLKYIAETIDGDLINLGSPFEVTINKSFEELIALVYLVSKTILGPYFDYSERFISVPGPTNEELQPKYIYNEVFCLIENFKLLGKLQTYCNGCFEAYLMLTRQVDDVLMKKNVFLMIKNSLEKGRYLCNRIIKSLENSIKDFQFDKKLINKYQKLIDTDLVYGLDPLPDINAKKSEIAKQQKKSVLWLIKNWRMLIWQIYYVSLAV